VKGFTESIDDEGEESAGTISTHRDVLAMKKLTEFLASWESSYREETARISIFTPEVNQISKDQAKQFCRLFYHARGHFYRFLWIMASWAPSNKYQTIIMRNIADELGALAEHHQPHEQLFFHFAECIDPDIREEVVDSEHYLPFLRSFDDGHVQALLQADWDGKWSIFSAYEFLDNTDYENLYLLAQRLGVTGDALTFFEVHRGGDHFGSTFDLLEDVWERQPQKVEESFAFIASHQLRMWRGISDLVLSKQVSVYGTE